MATPRTDTSIPRPTADGRSRAGVALQAGSPVSWVPKKELEVSEWASVGRRIGAVGRSIQWLLGDWIMYGNAKFGERYSRASKITGYDTQTLMNMVYVASRFVASRRREALSWSHHETLAALESEEQDGWLDEAERHHWSVSDLRTMLRLARKASRGNEVAIESPGHALAVTPMLRCPHCGEEFAAESER
jgi:hypothetical protein